MKKRKARHGVAQSVRRNEAPQKASFPIGKASPAQMFTFGEPVPVLDRREMLDYIECTGNGKWYDPPISFDGLARSLRAAVHHS